MRVEVTDDVSGFRDPAWNALVQADPEGTFFHTTDYLKLWWEEFGGGELRLAAVEGDRRAEAVCAFEVRGGELRFLGGFDVTDYLGPVGVPGSEDAAAKELLAAMLSDPSWVRADLRGLPREGRWLGALEHAATAHGLLTRTGSDGAAPMIDLHGSAEAYLAGLPAKLRHEIRRKARRLAERPGGYRVRVASPESLREDLDRFIELHRASPGPKGGFLQPHNELFFRRLAEAFHPPHRFHLAFLEVGEERAAAVIGFGFKDTFSLYNSALDRTFEALAPGMVLVADLIGMAAEQGRTRFDLLKGDLGYKYRFGPRPREIGRLVLERPAG